MYVCSCSVVQLCLTLCDPIDCNPPGSSVHLLFQARILKWVAIFFSIDSDTLVFKNTQYKKYMNLYRGYTAGFFPIYFTNRAFTALVCSGYHDICTGLLKHRSSFLIVQRLGSPRSRFQCGRFHGAASPPGRVVATILLCAHMTSLSAGRERETDITRVLASLLIRRLIP